MSIQCRLCGGEYSDATYRLIHSVYRECDRCRSWRRIESLASAVQKTDFEETYGDKSPIRRAALVRKRIWPDLLDRMEKERRPVPDGSEIEKGRQDALLDVGCGYGDFLVEARFRGWQVQGIEINPTMRAEAGGRGLKVTGEPLIECVGRLPAFDAVTYWNVLDSIESPDRELEAVSQVLEPGGVLWIRVPNADFHTRILKRASRGGPLGDFYLARELSPLNAWIYSSSGIVRLLESKGFGRVLVAPASLGHRGISARAISIFGRLLGTLTGNRVGFSSSLLVGAQIGPPSDS